MKQIRSLYCCGDCGWLKFVTVDAEKPPLTVKCPNCPGEMRPLREK